jgi:hypothetical protein
MMHKFHLPVKPAPDATGALAQLITERANPKAEQRDWHAGDAMSLRQGGHGLSVVAA